jgi:hypothetical protein
VCRALSWWRIHLPGQNSGLFFWTDSLFNSSGISLTPNLRSERTKGLTLSTFAPILRISSCSLLGLLARFLTLLWAAYDIQKYSISFTSLYTKLDVYSLLQVLVTPFPTNSILRTHTSSSAAWEWRTHLVCSFCEHKLKHVQTRLGTWTCLMQHPSYMLRPFEELNCLTI